MSKEDKRKGGFKTTRCARCRELITSLKKSNAHRKTCKPQTEAEQKAIGEQSMKYMAEFLVWLSTDCKGLKPSYLLKRQNKWLED